MEICDTEWKDFKRKYDKKKLDLFHENVLFYILFTYFLRINPEVIISLMIDRKNCLSLGKLSIKSH